jgi:hypothetical protein
MGNKEEYIEIEELGLYGIRDHFFSIRRDNSRVPQLGRKH